MTIIKEEAVGQQQSLLKRDKRQSRITDSFLVTRNSGGEREKQLADDQVGRKKSTARSKVAPKVVKRSIPVADDNVKVFEDNNKKEARVEIFTFQPSEEELSSEELPKIPAFKRFTHLLPNDSEESEKVVTLREQGPAKKTLTEKTSVVDEDFTALAPTLPIVPAYQRFSHLLGPTRGAFLPLPSKFQLLDKILGAIDSLCMLAAARDQPVIFHRSIKILESSVGRRVETVHARQLYGLFTDAPNAIGSTALYKFRPIKVVHEGKRIESFALELPKLATHEYLADRKSFLQRRLFELVTVAHDKFLAEIGVAIPVGAILKRWHPKFDVESVADPPAVDFFESTTKTLKGAVPTDIQKAIELEESSDITLPSPPSSDASLSPGSKSPKNSSTTAAPSAVTSSSSVLERIKAKQRDAELSRMTHDPIKEALRRKYEFLLEFSETIAMLFATSTKVTLLLGDVVTRVTQGAKSSISSNEALEKIESLAEIAPDWLKVISTGAVKMLRIDRMVSISTVRERLQAKLRSI